MQYKAETPDDYISQLPEGRKSPITKLRNTILENIPKGFDETISYGMIGYVVPLSTYPSGYHCDPKLPLPFMNLASQKNFIALYNMGIYVKKNVYDWFISEYPSIVNENWTWAKVVFVSSISMIYLMNLLENWYQK